MIIYADILFAVNFIMDYLSLYMSAKVLNFRSKGLMFCVASAIGGIYSLLGLYFYVPEPYAAVGVSLIMCFVAFGKKRFSAFIKAVILFYITGMLLGGIMTFLYNVICKYKNALLFDGGLKSWMFFALAGIVFLISSVASRIFSNFMYCKNIHAEIQFGSDKKTVCLLCDTGNLLRDPFSNLPVIVLRAGCLDSILGKDGIHRHPDKAQNEPAIKYKLRYIPVKTASGSTIMPAVSADKIRILSKKGNGTEIEAVIASDSISGSTYGGCDGVIPYSLAFNF